VTGAPVIELEYKRMKTASRLVELLFYTKTERAEKTWRSEAFAFITGFSLTKRESRNLGITAIGRLFCHRSVRVNNYFNLYRGWVILHILEEVNMATYLRIWVVPRVFNLVPETFVLGMGFFGFFGAGITRFGWT